MKMHSGVDANSGLIQTVVCTAANEADMAHVHELLHGQESCKHGDNGYTGLDKRQEVKTAQDEGRLRKDIDWRIAMKRGQLKAMPEEPRKAMYAWFVRRKAQVRAIVEHPFHIIKNLFGYRKVSYRSIAKNQVRAKAYAALVNLYIARRQLMAQGDQCARSLRKGQERAAKDREKHPGSASGLAAKRSVSDYREPLPPSL